MSHRRCIFTKTMTSAKKGPRLLEGEKGEIFYQFVNQGGRHKLTGFLHLKKPTKRGGNGREKYLLEGRRLPLRKKKKQEGSRCWVGGRIKNPLIQGRRERGGD